MSADIEIPYVDTPRPDTGLPNAKLGIWLFLASEVMLFGALFSSYVLLRVGATDAEWARWLADHKLLSVPLAFVNTIILISSSVTMVMAWAELMMNNFKRHQVYLLLTILLSLGFMVIKYIEYSGKYHHKEVTWTETVEIDGRKEKKSQTRSGHIISRSSSVIYLEADPLPGEHTGAEKNRGEKHERIEIPVDENTRIDWFGPHHSTFLAIYFTLTGLHGLHILGGVIVMIYFLGPGAKMWQSQPNRFAGRIECTGLYWHFVDLVWIFLFPVLYLL